MIAQTDFNEIQTLAKQLLKSDLIRQYEEAFGVATGCPIRAYTKQEHDAMKESHYPFQLCLCLPVELNGRTLAYLCADALRQEGMAFDDTAKQLLEDGCSAAELRSARRCYDEAMAISPERAKALETMLRMFAAQLGEAAEKMFLQTHDCEPESIRRARKYIHSNLAEPLMLEDVAEEAGVSAFHFCKVFKRATGLTFTHYVNRARVEQAKKMLLKPQARVTEVAYDSGFQSLSQFNRSFRRIVSLSPTEYRSRLHERTASVGIAV